jgi:5-hydroxyisourate hydrolase-like protein (transthyretin family)
MEEDFFMHDTTSKVNKKKMERTDELLLTEYSKMQYYDSNDYDLEEEEEESNNKECTAKVKLGEIDKKKFKNGEIIVISFLDFEKHEYFKGIKINLYKINGLAPVLIESKITDDDGKVIFSELDQGCYRIIEIIDKRYFEKPKYINWNEIVIDNINKNKEIIVVNTIKKNIQ